MVMRRVRERLMAEIAAATEVPPRRQPFPAELYNLSDYLTSVQPRPLPPPEIEAADSGRPPRPKETQAAVTQRAQSSARRQQIRTALSSRSGLQQAFIVQEVVGPPKSLRPWDELH